MEYLAYLPQSEGFLPKWLFFVSSARVIPLPLLYSPS
jgi:hypothetical protein